MSEEKQRRYLDDKGDVTIIVGTTKLVSWYHVGVPFMV